MKKHTSVSYGCKYCDNWYGTKTKAAKCEAECRARRDKHKAEAKLKELKGGDYPDTGTCRWCRKEGQRIDGNGQCATCWNDEMMY